MNEILKNIDNLITESKYKKDTTHHYRSNIEVGDYVCGVRKEDQRKDVPLTCGYVTRHLTSKPKHTRGIKVKIEREDNGEMDVIRVQEIYK
jgi:uncharacterized repeat protein (TIGR03833 family)